MELGFKGIYVPALHSCCASQSTVYVSVLLCGLEDVSDGAQMVVTVDVRRDGVSSMTIGGRPPISTSILREQLNVFMVT